MVFHPFCSTQDIYSIVHTELKTFAKGVLVQIRVFSTFFTEIASTFTNSLVLSDVLQESFYVLYGNVHGLFLGLLLGVWLHQGPFAIVVSASVTVIGNDFILLQCLVFRTFRGLEITS